MELLKLKEHMNHEVRDFEMQVLQRSTHIPVLVDFWAPWCGPCRTLGPVLERMAEQASGRWELVKVNTEENQELAAAFNIASIPAVKLFVNGEVRDEFVGALPEREIRRFLDKALPSPNAQPLTEAKRFLNEGAHSTAAKLLASIVDNEPGNFEARVLLAQAHLTLSPEQIPALLQPVTPDSEFADRANAIRTLARLAQLPDQPGILPADKIREKYLAAAHALRFGDFGKALDALIEVLERSKDYDNGGAKEACKAIFQLLGMRHPLVERSFRAFSSALHA
jgi:putative thioredoxin